MSIIAQGIRVGDWYAHCQVCGGRYFGSTMVNRWDNLFVCTKCDEPRNPADTPVVIVDTRMPPRVSTMQLSNTLEFDSPTADSTDNWYNNGQGNIV